jgi:hypothetical protein
MTCFSQQAQGDLFDPLWVERSAPTDDNEAESIKALCRSATPGPLFTDDRAEETGAVVATLPDGRHIVSMTASAEQTKDRAVIEANARLICKAEGYLLRLLRDRERWKQQLEFLQQRIRTLESALESERAVAQRTNPGGTSHVASIPR